MAAAPTSLRAGATPMEKGAAVILSALIITVLTWIASSVQQSQLQYARIEERLNAQTTTLAQIQKTIDASNRHYDELDQRLRTHDTRLTILEQKVTREAR